MKPATKKEHAYMGRVKELSCGNCGKPSPSNAHHLLTGGQRFSHYATIPLCDDCHTGTQGVHGDRTLWMITKKSELKVLADTLARLDK